MLFRPLAGNVARLSRKASKHQLPMRGLLVVCFFTWLMPAFAWEDATRSESDPFSNPILPLEAPAIAPAEPKKASDIPSVNWGGVLKQSFLFAGIEHAFRLATEPGTRDAGFTVRGYLDSVGSLHGWSDGDPAFVNYLGHPLQGAASAFIWAQNDMKYKSVRFGRDPRYWKSRLRAAGYAFVYSTQFEIGPFSEASVGLIQSRYPQQGFVDHVVTPTLGMAWMVGEDAIDRYVLIPLERRFDNMWVRVLTRGFLNPSRSMANMMRGKVPFYRDDRSLFGHSAPERKFTGLPPAADPAEEKPDAGPAPFELTAVSVTRIPAGGNAPNGCSLGGGGEAAFRIADHWQLVGSVTGCRVTGYRVHASGDSLSWLIGPRWSPSSGRFRPYMQVRAGGLKLTAVTESAELKDALTKAALAEGRSNPSPYEYTRTESAHGLAIAAGTGLDLRLARAAAIKLASLEYVRAWTPPLYGVEYNRGLEFKMGLTLRMGTW